MPAKKKPPAPPAPGQPRHYDPSLGKLALAQLAPRLKTLQPEDLLSTRIDLDAAAFAALATYMRATAPALRARFQKQHDAGEFDIAHLDDLEELAFAVLYAHAEASAHRASDSGAKLPAALVERAIELEARMQALCEYHFRDDPEIAAELDRLRPGTSHRDLASDLNGYARIYDLRRDIVALDRKHYRETDLVDARAVAGVIFTTLSAGASSKARIAQDTLARAWTLLCRSYDEVRAVGLYVLRHNADKHRFFPSLFSAAKNHSPGRRKPKTVAVDHEEAATPE
ncbi:MAG: hypothetical protein IPM54_30135 [Polyangiaceae bacterium]|nr:hypothetical protein [Polyangiaceae bacterium]